MILLLVGIPKAVFPSKQYETTIRFHRDSNTDLFLYVATCWWKTQVNDV